MTETGGSFVINIFCQAEFLLIQTGVFCRICSRFTIRQRIVICLAGKIVDQKKKVVLFYPFIVVIILDSTRKLSFAHKIGSEVNILHIWEKF